MDETPLTATSIAFRIKRAEQFARAWRSNAQRLQALASDPRTPKLTRDDALHEARTASTIVARRAEEIAGLARTRGYSSWEADPMLGPLVVEIRSVQNALILAAETLSRS